MAEIFLVEFKGSSRGYFYNNFYHTILSGDYVIVQAERGENIALVRMKVEKEIESVNGERPGSILRKASDEDVAIFHDIQKREIEYRSEVIEIIARHKLNMKVVDIELQFDGNKMTVYFTADHRVDFRELVKDLAARYRTRIELRQIGVRDEARRVDGHGICGLRQCCNAFIKDFEPISTQHAREQDLPLNPSKISGNCGRLLCCLRFEADTYTACKKKFPQIGKFISTKSGNGILERIDVFNEEAIIRDEEHIRFRAHYKDIESVGTGINQKDFYPPVDKSAKKDTEENSNSNPDIPEDTDQRTDS